MQLSEVLETKHIYNDDKARRRLNTAPTVKADITLKEINEGVTIERLEAINVPVYQYGTQITIHGTFPELHNDKDYLSNVLGYKSLFLNQNKSLGVKYVAIDGAKKRLILDIARYSKTKWNFWKSSEGLHVSKMFWTRRDKETNTDKQDCIDCYKSTPDDLYIGGKEAGALMYGGYAVIVHIGAIYEKNLWNVIKWFTGIESQAEFETIKELDRIKQEREDKEYEARAKIEREVKQAELANFLKNFVAPSNWQPFKGKIEKNGTYARIHDTWRDGLALQVIKTAKRGAYLCANVKNFTDFKFIDWQPSHYTKGNYTIDGWIILDKPTETLQTLENKASTPDVKAIGQDITITHNEKLNGIEIAFKSKPSDTVLDMLRNNGFRWSYKSMLWYARYNKELMDKMNNELIGDKELCKVCTK